MGDFDKPLTKVVDKWLGTGSASNYICMMLKVNDVKTYEDFRVIEKDSIAALERPIARAPTKLKEVPAIGLNKTISYIQFLETFNEQLADDPSQWDKK